MKNTTAYKQGQKAAKLGVPIEQSDLVNLHPESDRYDQFIAGYDSVTIAECDCDDCEHCEVN